MQEEFNNLTFTFNSHSLYFIIIIIIIISRAELSKAAWQSTFNYIHFAIIKNSSVL